MWSRLARELRARGHEVFTPSLTGIGERVHLAAPQVNLSTHVADVTNALEYERLERVVLVGHSYGGMVVTGAADRAAPRIAALVYLDAFVPQHGQSVVDLAPPALRERLPREDRPHFTPYLPPLPPQAQGMSDPDELAWIEGRRSPQPLATFTEKLSLEGRYRGPRRYIGCSGYSPSTFRPFAERLKSDPAWRYDELATHHYPQISMPRETARLLETT
jgi:pimeloyl-ACP methyl ester carboxylesterase